MKLNFIFLLLAVGATFGCAQQNYLGQSKPAPSNLPAVQSNINDDSLIKTISSNQTQSEAKPRKQCYGREKFEVTTVPDLIYRENCPIDGLPLEVLKTINQTAKGKYQEFVVEATIGVDKTNPQNPQEHHYLIFYPKDEKGNFSYSGESWLFVQTKRGWRLDSYNKAAGKAMTEPH